MLCNLIRSEKRPVTDVIPMLQVVTSIGSIYFFYLPFSLN